MSSSRKALSGGAQSSPGEDGASSEPIAHARIAFAGDMARAGVDLGF
jgi:hypothetical protein